MRKFKACVATGAAAAVAAALLASGGTPAPQAHHQPSTRLLAQARTALVRYLRHNHSTLMLAHPVGRRRGADGVTLKASWNWSGYADVSTKSGAFTKVAGSWTISAVTCTAEDTLVSQWVGLDGYTSATAEQEGTLSWCFGGKAFYYTWYEMYPNSTVDVGTSPQAGDKITASVTRSSASYTLKLTDATNTANSFTEKASCATSTCLDTSAEWIAERPSFSIGMAPLADYGAWTVTGGTEIANGVTGTIGSYATVDQIEMVDATDSYVLSTPSTLITNKSFTTTWDNSY
jgi:Peptidase A4 family